MAKESVSRSKNCPSARHDFPWIALVLGLVVLVLVLVAWLGVWRSIRRAREEVGRQAAEVERLAEELKKRLEEGENSPPPAYFFEEVLEEPTESMLPR